MNHSLDSNVRKVDISPNGPLDFSSQHAAWINEQFVPENETDLRIEQIVRRGYTVFEDVYDSQELEAARDKIDRIYSEQVEEVGDEKILVDIGDANIARQLLAYDDFFLKSATNPKITDIIRKMMGDYIVLYQQNANIHMPGTSHTTGPWHRDLTFLHFTSSRPIAMTALHIIDDYTEENGGLSILPGTHRDESFPSFDYLDENKVFVCIPAGSVLLFDSNMWHSPGINGSNNPKRSMSHFYTVHLVRQEISLPHLLKGKYSDDPELRRLLGYDIMQTQSVREWRMEKFQNSRKNLTVY